LLTIIYLPRTTRTPRTFYTYLVAVRVGSWLKLLIFILEEMQSLCMDFAQYHRYSCFVIFVPSCFSCEILGI